MNNQWTTQRGQLDQALDLERALRQARRRLAVWQRTPTPTALRVPAHR